VLLADRIKETRKLRDEKHYRSVIDECGKILQTIFEELYNAYFPKLYDEEVEKVLNFRKQTGKTTDKFTIGEWIGLFKVVNLFGTIQNHLKKTEEKEFIFFTFEMTTQLKELRNRNTHSDKDLVCYSEQQLASYLESATVCMLQELKMISEADLVGRRTPVKQSPDYQKAPPQISREDVLRATKDPAINDFKFSNKFVEIDGVKYPARGLVSLALGVSPSNLTLELVTKILSQVDFKVIDEKISQTSPLSTTNGNEAMQMPYSTIEEGLLHITSTKLYGKFEDLLLDTKKQYSKIDGVKDLTAEIARDIIVSAWKKNHKMLVLFKNDAFRGYLEDLLAVKLD
jgi:hypothetical protein